ncbi:MAG: peptide deformylase [Candidatus Cloacimonetes bacterium HGW-Cloacimonetes-1]|jgi:peptide deformylase|nr:MAG: peptide deformylase [Candidatus Cloacimonetes bacterium HGW-Cloacimonetes-1]
MKKEAQLLPIHIFGDDMLRQKLSPVVVYDDKLHEFVHDLTHTMYLRDGVGLASSQVGKNLRVFVIDLEWSHEDGKPEPIVMINPDIYNSEGEIEYEEGCISVPGVYATVRRPSRIEYSYYDINGIQHHEIAEGFKAVVIQHENDHLDGVLFIDHLSSLSKLKIKRKLKELQKTAVNGSNLRHDIYDPEA